MLQRQSSTQQLISILLRMMSRLIRAVRRGGKSPLLFFLGLFCLAVNMNAQVVFLGEMFQKKKVNLGETCFVEFSLVNPKDVDAEVILLKKDILIENEQVKFLKPGVVSRSNAEWVKIEHPRMLLEGKKRVELRIPVEIPDEVGLRGSYYSCLIVHTMSHFQDAQTEKQLNVVLRYAIQVITTIEGGKQAVEFEKIQVIGEEKDVLQVEVANDGDEFLELWLKSELEGVEPRFFRIYPFSKRRLKLNLESLEDDSYKTRLFMDDGEMLLIPIKIEFRKGEVKEPLPLFSVGKSIKKKRKGKNYLRLWLVLSAGNLRRGLSVSGNTSFDSFRVGSGYRRFWMLGDGGMYESQYMSLGLKVWKFSFSQYVYRFENQVLLNSGIRLTLKRINMNLGFMGSKTSKVINLNFTAQLPWGNHRLQGYVYMMRQRKGWSLSYSIPFTIYF